jgi:hypothetical protein
MASANRLLEVSGRAEDFTMRVQNSLGELTSQGFELAKRRVHPLFFSVCLKLSHIFSPICSNNANTLLQKAVRWHYSQAAR